MFETVTAYLSTQLQTQLHSLLHRDDQGASAVEYALLVAAIAAVIVVVLFVFGSVIQGVFSTTCGSIRQGAAC